MKKRLTNFIVFLGILTIFSQLLLGEKVYSQTTLVLIHDTLNTSSQQKRLADKDTLLSNLPYIISGYNVQTFDSSSTLSFLTSSAYKTIIIQETSFDAIQTRYMGLTARTNLMTWLASGSSGDKKSLILIGADIAYNYSRTGSGGLDLVFSNTVCKFNYQVDNGSITGQYSITGNVIDSGNVRMMTNSPAGAGYYPDGVGNYGLGIPLYKYTGRASLTDSLAAIGYSGTNYVVASAFQDPRYFINGDVRFVLSKIIIWVKQQGGTITGVSNITNSIPVKYELSQNYPNPFNPVTKINYSIPKSGIITLKVYDILGRNVTTLVNEFKNAGNYSVEFNADNLSSGVYTYRLESGSYVETKKMLLVK
jgi:hypothetical protein